MKVLLIISFQIFIFNATSSFGSRTTGSEAYDAVYSYDPNGNLLTLQRHDHEANLSHDYEYEYFAGTNRLRKVTDEYTPEVPVSKTYNTNPLIADGQQYKHIILDDGATVPAGHTAEIEATETITFLPGVVIESGATFTASIVAPATVPVPPEGQFLYDEIGNLIRDNVEGVSIEWTPYGKVRSVVKDNGDVMSFRYDASGNRVEKAVTTGETTTTTHYIRDASGNVMATYTDSELKEQPIYGSSRVGMYLGGAEPGKEKLGMKRYELSNHLGNVLAVITDNINIIPEDDMGGPPPGGGGPPDVGSPPQDVLHPDYNVFASVASVSDYYPFGLAMPGRTFSADEYRYGFNGKEKDPEGLGGGGSTYDYGFRIYNPGIGKFLSVDPLTSSYPWYTPYQFAGNMPIWAIDLDGLEEQIYILSKNYSTEINGLLTSEKPDYELINWKLNWNLEREFADRWMHEQLIESKIEIPNYNLSESNFVLHRQKTNERAKGIEIYGVFESSKGSFELKLLYEHSTRFEEWYFDKLIFGNFEGNRTFYDMGYSQGYSGDRTAATVWGGFLTYPETTGYYQNSNFSRSEGYKRGKYDFDNWWEKYHSHEYYQKYPEMYEWENGVQPIDVTPRNEITGERE